MTLRDLTAFLRDTLRRDVDYVEPLARLIQAKTDGNPFFVIQFLKTLAQEGLFVFDHEHGGWSFTLEAIADAGITDNVVDLMTRKIQRLSPNAQRVMTLAACIGNPFDWATFLTVNRQSRHEAQAGLSEALEAGLPVHRADEHRRRRSYSFLHDRVQQAAYGLIPDADKTPFHLDAGRLLLADFDPDAGDDRIFTIVNHLNIGRHLIVDRDERVAVAALNLAAGRKAKMSSAYHVAVDHFARGIALLEPSDWDAEYDPDVVVAHRGRGVPIPGGHVRRRGVSVAPTAGSRDQRPRSGAGSQPADDLVREPVALGRRGIRRSGWTRTFWNLVSDPRSEKEAALDRELNAVQGLLGTRTISSLIDLADMTDPDIRIVMRSLTILWAPAYISGDDVLARLISATMVRLSLANGHDGGFGVRLRDPRHHDWAHSPRVSRRLRMGRARASRQQAL